MGSKNNPSEFDCWSRAEPDEPVFVLLGRDPVACVVVDAWANLRQVLGDHERDKLAEARSCAEEMARWAKYRGKELEVVRAYSAASEASDRLQSLKLLCQRAAGVVEQWVMINESDGGLRGRKELEDLARELREATR